MAPKESKRADVSWFNKADKLPNETELLFLALLLVTKATDINELKQWAWDVGRRAPSFQQRGSAALPV